MFQKTSAVSCGLFRQELKGNLSFLSSLNRCFFVAAMIVGCSTMSVAQTIKIDSLRQLAKKLSGPSKVDVLNQVSFYLLNYNNDLFVANSKETLALSKEIGYEKGIAEATILAGAAEYTLGHPADSYNQIREGLRMSRRLHENGLVGYSLIQLGINYQYDDRIDSAMFYFRKSYAVLKDSLHPYYLARSYLGMADCYGLRSDYKNQIQYLNRCLKIQQLLGDETVTWLQIRLAAYYTEHGNLPSAEKYLHEARKYFGADTIDNESISEIQALDAVLFFKKGNYPQALNYFYSARRFFEKNQRKQKLVSLLYDIGLVFESMGNYDLSLKNYFEALEIAERNHYTLEAIHLNYAIAWAYLRLGQASRSFIYAEASLKSAQTNKHPADIGNALNLLGMLNGAAEHDKEAFEFYRRSLGIRKGLQDQLREATVLFNIGTLFEKKGMLDSSLHYQQHSLDIRKMGNDEEALADSYHIMGRLYMKRHNYSLAGDYLDRAERLAEKIKISYILLNVYETKRELLKEQRLFEKALEYSRRYENLRDSIFDHQLTSRLNLLENIYNLQEKENEIVRLNQQRLKQKDDLTIQAAQIRQQKTIIWFTIAILVLVCAVAFVIYRYYLHVKGLNRDVSERNEEIQAQTEELTESNNLLGQLNEAILRQKKEIEEQSEELTARNETISKINESLEERIQSSTSELKQAYKELDTFFYRASHDFRRPLTTFMGLYEVAKITLKDSNALDLFEKVNDTARSLDKMLFKLQSISDVGSQELIYKEISLSAVFELELDNFNSDIQRNHIQVEKIVSVSNPFYSYQALIQIIIRNLLENAIDFCNKVHPVISLKAISIGNDVMIEVSDNGEGIPQQYKDRVFDMYFRANDRSKGNGLGLYIVKKTVQKLNGRIELTTAIDRGTIVKVYLPNQQQGLKL